MLVTALAVSLPVGPAFAVERGPKLTEPPGDRLAALNCYGELAASPRPPVLLVHGTLMTPEEAWSWGYQKVLLERGHSACTVRLPEFGFGDAQRSVEYVVTAIREVGRRSGRRLSIVGHSLGGLQPLFALRVWPAAARYVEDFVGLAGVYDRGSQWAREQLDPSTRTPESRPSCTERCVPSLTQEASGSKLLGALGKRDLPAGPSYTAIGTLYDEYITPQPRANELPGGRPARSMQIQDVCPGRRFWPPSRPYSLPVDHVSLLGDAVAHALVLDALEHPGPAHPERIPRSVCLKAAYDGFDPAGFARAMTTVVPRFAEPQKEVEQEPPLRAASTRSADHARRSCRGLVESRNGRGASSGSAAWEARAALARAAPQDSQVHRPPRGRGVRRRGGELHLVGPDPARGEAFDEEPRR